MGDRSCNTVPIVLKNFNYEHDIDYALKMCRWALKCLGLWPLVSDRTRKQEKVISTILLATWFFDLLFSLIPPSCYIIFQEKNLYRRVKLLGPVGFCMSSTFKYSYLVLKGTVFGRCIDHVERDWQVVDNPIHRNIMLKQSSISRHLIALCAIFIYTGGISYQTVMSFLSKGRVVGNRTMKPLMYPGYDTFLDTQSSPTYEIIYSIHWISGLIKYSVTTAAYSLAVIFVTHICGQIQIQTERLKNLVRRNEKEGSRHDFLAVIVRDHVNALRFSRDVEEALREICLTEIVESTLIICLLECYCLMEWENSDVISILMYFILLTSFTFNILIFCYIGQVMSEECTQIGPAAYEIEWYTLPPKEASDLIFLSVMSQYPPKLTAGKIFELSLNTFVKVMQTSVVYLNLLRTIADW
ncbi:odorant receptor 67c-like [Hylaeus anthracinus]|uniref:odorant receptor 67c-like n=1 Tax=Hylaeus anthracinus TaxID=313031 RepID=UPI0023B8DE01|nr:odorant receptor 67c-like [Hylaeus anthracinus]